MPEQSTESKSHKLYLYVLRCCKQQFLLLLDSNDLPSAIHNWANIILKYTIYVFKDCLLIVDKYSSSKNHENTDSIKKCKFNSLSVLDIYNRPRDFWCTFFLRFLQFSQELKKIQKLTIYHLKGLIVDIFILEGQGQSKIRNWPNPLIVKKQTFQEKWAWQVLEAATPLSF